MTYEITKDYVCDYCGKKQTKDEQVTVLIGDYIMKKTNYSPLPPIGGVKFRYACKDCIRKGLVKGWSLDND